MLLNLLGFHKYSNEKKRIICSNDSYLQCFCKLCHSIGIEGQLKFIHILTLSLPRYLYLFSCLPSFSPCLLREFGIGSTNHTFIDIFLYSHHLSVWYCINVVGRSSVLVTHGS